jgi:hypothetical protein
VCVCVCVCVYVECVCFVCVCVCSVCVCNVCVCVYHCSMCVCVVPSVCIDLCGVDNSETLSLTAIFPTCVLNINVCGGVFSNVIMCINNIDTCVNGVFIINVLCRYLCVCVGVCCVCVCVCSVCVCVIHYVFGCGPFECMVGDDVCVVPEYSLCVLVTSV